jgi:hypothetical protein
LRGNVGKFEKETVKREREERVFRMRVCSWKKIDIEEREERKECSGSSKDKNGVIHTKA